LIGGSTGKLIGVDCSLSAPNANGPTFEGRAASVPHARLRYLRLRVFLAVFFFVFRFLPFFFTAMSPSNVWTPVKTANKS
jgi:hypothetical protein